MTIDRAAMWAIVEQTREGDPHYRTQENRLESAVDALSPKDQLAFAEEFDQCLDEAAKYLREPYGIVHHD